MKRVLSIAALALAGSTTLVACGGGAPTDASEDEFCDVVGIDSLAEYGDEESGEFDAEDYGNALEEVGTPEGIGDDARKGFEIKVDALKDAGNGITEEDLDDIDEPDGDDEDKVEAFSTYVDETCGSGLE